jgi:hypothetical protein
MRFYDRRPEIEERLWNYLHVHPANLVQMLESSTADIHTILTEVLLLATLLECLDATFLAQMNSIVPFLGTGLQTQRVYATIASLLGHLRKNLIHAQGT